MNNDVTTPVTGLRRMAPPPPRWATVAAHATVLATLPSGLWRVAMALGVPVGFSAEVLRDLYDVPGWGLIYVIGLSVFQESLALLTFGLVRQWGEVVPRWIPLIGGKRVKPMAAVIPAALGAVLLTLIMGSQVIVAANGVVDRTPMTPRGETVMRICYLPLVLWGPLLGAVTVSYYRHHRARAAG